MSNPEAASGRRPVSAEREGSPGGPIMDHQQRPREMLSSIEDLLTRVDGDEAGILTDPLGYGT